MENTLLTAWSNLHDHLMHFVMARTGDANISQDIVHDVFLKVQSKIGTLDNKEKLNSWIFAITRNAITDHYRRTRHSIPVDTHELSVEIVDKKDTLELSKCMMPMIQTLPDKYREALVMVDLKGMSQKQLAEHLNISYSGAKSRVQRAREKLKQAFVTCCEISSDSYGNILEYRRRQCCHGCD